MRALSRRTRISETKFRAALERVGPDVYALMEELGCSRATVYRRLGKINLGQREIYSQVNDGNELDALIPKENPARIHREIDEQVEKLFALSKPSLLIGPTGSGKSTIPEGIAAILKLPFLRISCDAGLELSELLGGWVLLDGTMEYMEGLLVKIMQVPSIILFDEVNALDPIKSLMLHQLLDSGSLFVKDINKTYRLHHEASIFLAANPPGPGYFVNEMSAALLNRVTVVKVPPFSTDEIRHVLKQQRHKLNADILEKLLRFYSEIQRFSTEQMVNAQISIRNAVNFVDVYVLTNDIKTSLDVCFVNGILMTDSREVKETCEKIARTVFGDLYSGKRF